MGKFKDSILNMQKRLESLYNREIEKFGGIGIWETISGRDKKKSHEKSDS